MAPTGSAVELLNPYKACVIGAGVGGVELADVHGRVDDDVLGVRDGRRPLSIYLLGIRIPKSSVRGRPHEVQFEE